MKKASKVYLNGCVENTSVYSIKLKKMLKNNTSGVRGVTFDKASQKWKAQIVFKGRNYYLSWKIHKQGRFHKSPENGGGSHVWQFS